MQSPKDYIRFTLLIHTILVTIQIAFLAIAIWVIVPKRVLLQDYSFQIADATAFIICMLSAYLIYNNRIKKARLKRGIREKLIVYKKGLYLQWIIVSIFSIFSIIFYIMTGDFLYIFTTVFSIIIIGLNKPSIKRTCEDLELDKSERDVLRTPNAAI